MTTFTVYCISGLFIFAAIVLFLKNFLFLIRAETAKGEIIGDDRQGTGDEGSLSRPVVQFKTKDGQVIEFIDSSWVDDSFEIFGWLISLVSKKNPNKVEVVYDPANPKRARIKNFTHFYFFAILLIVIGILIAASLFLPVGKLLDFVANLPF